MKRALVVAGLVLAVVLASTLIPRSAHVFDVPEVLRTFRRNGIVLIRQPFDPRKALEVLSAPRQDVVVVVYRRAKPGDTGPWQLPASASRAHRRNVFAAWTERGAAVRRALGSLHYSSGSIGVPEVVVITLHPGESQTLRRTTAPNGAQVQCVHGYDAPHRFVDFAHFRPGWLNGVTVQLHWQPEMPGWRFVLSCRSRAPS